MMKWLNGVISGLHALLRRDVVRRELDDELNSYLDAATAHHESLGLSPEAARRAARLDMGSSLHSVRQQIWESRWESVLENLYEDLRLSVRSLRRRPGFTAVALVSLALGIGANVAIFTLVRQVLLQKLPVGDPHLLVTFGESDSGGVAGGIDIGQWGLYPWDFTRQLESDPGPFQGIAAFGSFSDDVMLRRATSANSQNTPVVAPANLVSGNYFQVLNAHALLGRTLLPSDAASAGTGAVAVLSYSCWQRLFSADPAIIGQTVNVNDTPFTIVGVMPKPFQGLKLELHPVALWVPDTMQPVVLRQPSLLTPHSGLYFLHLFGRLAPDAAASDTAVLRRSQDWLQQRIHNAIRDRAGTALSPTRLQEIDREVVPLLPAVHGVSPLRAQYGDSLRFLMGVVVVILLIACANLANFLLARAAGSQREIATRIALGSNRLRIVRQSLIQSFVLSLAGAGLGLILAFVATRALIAFISRGTQSVPLSPNPDLRILLFTLLLSVLTALVFGFVPALVSSRTDRSLAFSFTTRTGQGGITSRLWPKTLITVQIAFSLVLLIGAGLFLQTLRNLQNQDYGFERSHLVVAQFSPRIAGYRPAQTPVLYRRLLERLHAQPGVRSVALAGTPPIFPGGWTSDFSIAGYTPAPKEDMHSTLNRVSGEYFDTAGISIVSGRGIQDRDVPGGLKVVVVNQTLARHFFPKGDAIGRSITVGIDSARGPWQIVGIARDTISSNPRDPAPVRMIYLPLAQLEPFLPPGQQPNAREENQDLFVNVILVRTMDDPARTAAALPSAVSAVDSNLLLLNVATMQEEISGFVSHDELISTLTTLFSALALLLASIGLYGVMTYNVQSRRGELAIRLALGAQDSAVRWMVVRESLLLLAIGVGVGLPLAIASRNTVAHLLYGLSPSDPITFAVALVVIAGMTVFASWLPARHASKVDPMIALRAD